MRQHSCSSPSSFNFAVARRGGAPLYTTLGVKMRDASKTILEKTVVGVVPTARWPPTIRLAAKQVARSKVQVVMAARYTAGLLIRHHPRTPVILTILRNW